MRGRVGEKGERRQDFCISWLIRDSLCIIHFIAPNSYSTGRREVDIMESDITESALTEFDITESDITEIAITEIDIKRKWKLI